MQHADNKIFIISLDIPYIQSFPTGHPLLPPKPTVWSVETHDRVSGSVLDNNSSFKVSISGSSFFLVIHMWQYSSASIYFHYIEETECYQYSLSSCIYPSISNKSPGWLRYGANEIPCLASGQLQAHPRCSVNAITGKVTTYLFSWLQIPVKLIKG
jgi:hypothetical protein